MEAAASDSSAPSLAHLFNPAVSAFHYNDSKGAYSHDMDLLCTFWQCDKLKLEKWGQAF